MYLFCLLFGCKDTLECIALHVIISSLAHREIEIWATADADKTGEEENCSRAQWQRLSDLLNRRRKQKKCPVWSVETLYFIFRNTKV